MNPMERLDKLVEQARQDAPPLVDVTARVRNTIASRSETDEPVIWVFGALSSAAAAVVAGVFTWNLWQTATDPFIGALSAAAGVGP